MQLISIIFFSHNMRTCHAMMTRDPLYITYFVILLSLFSLCEYFTFFTSVFKSWDNKMEGEQRDYLEVHGSSAARIQS
jgi:hypothetical protein